MSEESHENGATRDQLRRYLLETLPEAERQDLDRRLEADEALRALLEDTRAELAQLDLLPESAPPPGLADRAIAQVLEQDEAPAKYRFPWFPEGVVTAVAIMAIAFIVLPLLGRAREASRRASTENNMKQLGLVFKMYANESRGELWPPSVSVDGSWVPDLRTIYPEFMTDPGILITEGREGRRDRALLTEALEQEPPDWDAAHGIVARHFVYTGYLLREPEMFDAFAVASIPPERANIRLEDGRTINRLREGIERFLITDINNPAGSAQAQSDIPVVITNVFRDGAGHAREMTVLYMDGHVRRVVRREQPKLFEALERWLHPSPQDKADQPE